MKRPRFQEAQIGTGISDGYLLSLCSLALPTHKIMVSNTELTIRFDGKSTTFVLTDDLLLVKRVGDREFTLALIGTVRQ